MLLFLYEYLQATLLKSIISSLICSRAIFHFQLQNEREKMKRMCYGIISRIIFNPTTKGSEKEKKEKLWSGRSEQFSFSWCHCLKSHKSFIKKQNWIDRLNYKSLKFTVFSKFLWHLMWMSVKYGEGVGI